MANVNGGGGGDPSSTPGETQRDRNGQPHVADETNPEATASGSNGVMAQGEPIGGHGVPGATREGEREVLPLVAGADCHLLFYDEGPKSWAGKIQEIITDLHQGINETLVWSQIEEGIKEFEYYICSAPLKEGFMYNDVVIAGGRPV